MSTFTLLSGVRNRKVAAASMPDTREEAAGNVTTEHLWTHSYYNYLVSFDGSEMQVPVNSTFEQIWYYVSGNAILRNFTLRVHKFTFQWDLFMHLTICILALFPFAFSGHRLCIILPITVWIFYNTLFLVGTKRANSLVPGFANFKYTFKTTMEEFFSQKLLPVISISYLLVSLSLSVTGQRLKGAPLCFQPCGECLASWDDSVFIDKDTNINELDASRIGCGYSNGKELLVCYGNNCDGSVYGLESSPRRAY